MICNQNNCVNFVLRKIMKFIGCLLLFCCVMGSLSAQTTKPASKPAPLDTGQK